MRQQRRESGERVRAVDRARHYRDHDKRLAHLTRNTRRWREENPERYKAHNAVNNALRDGRLVKQPCEVCGSTVRVHGHHDDYSKPLDVRWLCPLHHAAERKEAA